MRDQADRLRQMAVGMRLPEGSDDGTTPILVVGSGKGGVGKSVISIVTAMHLAASGERVLLLDGDFNLANLHLLLGVQPVARLETLLWGDTTPQDLILAVNENLSVLPGDSGGEQLHNLGSVDKARLYHRLINAADGYDVVVVDAGAGIDGVLRCCAVPGVRPIVVTVPEPAALADAYAVIKIVNFQARGTPVTVLVNRADSDAQGRAAFDRLDVASQRFLQEPLNYLGAVPEDDGLRRAVRDSGPFWTGNTPLLNAMREHIDKGRAMFGLDAPAAAGTG